MHPVPTEDNIAHVLKTHGIQPTSQRVVVALMLFQQATHLSAEDVHRIVNAGGYSVSKATVYNTLGLLVERGMIREVIVDPARTFYDPNIEPHHHFFDVTTGRLQDIDAKEVRVSGLPSLPPGAVLDGVEVIVRFRSAPTDN